MTLFPQKIQQVHIVIGGNVDIIVPPGVVKGGYGSDSVLVEFATVINVGEHNFIRINEEEVLTVGIPKDIFG